LYYLTDYLPKIQVEVREKIKIVRISKPTVKATQEILMGEAEIIAKKHELKLPLFIKSKRGRSGNEVSAARREFCIMIMDKYKCTQNRLAEFFDVDHATITFYMKGKKYFRPLPKEKTA